MYRRFLTGIITAALLFYAASVSFPQSERQKEAQKRAEALFNGKPPAGTATVVGSSVIQSIHEGFGNYIILLEAADNEKIRNELGITEEQAKSLKNARDGIRVQALMNVPKYVERFKKMSDADKQPIQQDLVKDIKKISDYMDTVVPEEQKNKSRTLFFQAVGGLESPIVNPDMLKVLNLSDDQKQKTDAAFKELEQERIAQMEDGLKLVEKAVEKGGVNMSPEDREAIEKEGKALEARIFATGKKLGEKLRTFLTDDQKAMEKKLLANRPDFLPKLPGPMRGDYTKEYVPGLDSWSPGQGVPDKAKEKKRRRPFPQKEQTE
ncbi:hypothetical protein FACS189427_05560 [Planctomycetales bacterium]|nr:hypothetical protein FACS189427_05560 [Planctomycetales bacterium]